MQIFFSVGEPSGDIHGARLIRELQRQAPGIECVGFGGPLMEQAGGTFLYQLTNLAVMGFFAVVPLLGKFYSLYRQAKTYLATHRPAAVVLIDFPGFNWWIAKAAKRLGIPVYYYIPPQLWGWAPWRVRRVRKFVDHVLCTLPFEADWFQQRGVRNVQYVGHPFFDEVAEQSLDRRFIATVKSSKSHPAPIVAILPGSRGGEVRENFPIQLQIMQRLYRCLPGVRFVVANFKEPQRALCKSLLAASGSKLPVRFFTGRTAELIAACDVALMCSGSVSLELLAREKPAVVIYRIPRLYHFLSRYVLTCRFITLPNLIADRLIYPEFLCSGDASPVVERATHLLLNWLIDPKEREATMSELRALCHQFAQTGATERAAAAILHGIVPEQLSPPEAVATHARLLGPPTSVAAA